MHRQSLRLLCVERLPFAWNQFEADAKAASSPRTCPNSFNCDKMLDSPRSNAALRMPIRESLCHLTLLAHLSTSSHKGELKVSRPYRLRFATHSDGDPGDRPLHQIGLCTIREGTTMTTKTPSRIFMALAQLRLGGSCRKHDLRLAPVVLELIESARQP